MSTSTLRIGTRVRVHDEDGIVCCLDPLVYHTVAFCSYVPIYDDTPFTVVDDRRYDVTPLPERVRVRIQRYIAVMEQHRAVSVQATGGA